MDSGEMVAAGLFLVILGVVLLLLARRGPVDATRYALPTVAPMITPQMTRLLESTRGPLALLITLAGAVLLIVGVVGMIG